MAGKLKYPLVLGESRKDRALRLHRESRARLGGQRKNYARWKSADVVRYNKVVRGGKLRRKYGLTYEELCSIYENQEGLCAICSKAIVLRPITDFNSTTTACVDHDHKTGKIRGLLCRSCNFSLGGFEDNTSVLRNAISYLGGGQCPISTE